MGEWQGHMDPAINYIKRIKYEEKDNNMHAGKKQTLYRGGG